MLLFQQVPEGAKLVDIDARIPGLRLQYIHRIKVFSTPKQILVVGCGGAVRISGIQRGEYIVYMSAPRSLSTRSRCNATLCVAKSPLTFGVVGRTHHRASTTLLPHRPRSSCRHRLALGMSHFCQQHRRPSSVLSFHCGRLGDRPLRSYEYHPSKYRERHRRSCAKANRSSTGLARSKISPRARHWSLETPIAALCTTRFSTSSCRATCRQNTPPTAFPSFDAVAPPEPRRHGRDAYIRICRLKHGQMRR